MQFKVLAAVGMMMTLARRGADAAQCPTGVTTAPTVTTVMASKLDPENKAWIVNTDCSHTTVSLATSLFDDQTISLLDANIDRIASLPSGALTLYTNNARLSDGADLSGAQNLKNLAVVSASVSASSKLDLPTNLQYLYFLQSGSSTFKMVPSSLLEMDLTANAFTSINFPIPPKLQKLVMTENPMLKLERVVFPESLTSFACASCNIATIRGVKWSSKLANLDLNSNSIREFEIRQSDVQVFTKLSSIDFSTSQTTCSDEEATVEVIRGQRFCVISDERFESLYSSSSPPDGSGANDTVSPLPSTDESAASDGSEDTIRTSADSRDGLRGGGGGMRSSSSRGASDGTLEDQSATSTSSMSMTIVGILIATSSVFGTLLAVIAYRRYRAARRKNEASGDTPMLVDTSLYNNASSVNGGTSQEYLSNDIRNDKALIPFRIDQKDIRLSKQIARGGFGVIYRGVYNGRAVAVKQMQPDAWRNQKQLLSFMDEIRLCASLTHPKIVEFVGVAWTSLRDISVIIEFMTGGDLHGVIHSHAKTYSRSNPSAATAAPSSSSFVPSPRDWSEPWTTSAINCKTLIAKDVAEAIVYLHSFPSPVVHRDLKSKNVLLDTRGNAKLSDFGISREMVSDETMTSEVGTSAWIAPEVMRGDRYSEIADIYSLGVLLVELDRCCHPYAGEETLALLDGSAVRLAPMALAEKQPQPREMRSHAHQNMKIAMLVSSGLLRPKPSSTCPIRVQALIARCLNFTPEDRPSAMEVHYELRQILHEMKYRGTLL